MAIHFIFETGDTKKNLGIGLSRENIHRLIDKKPFLLKLSQYNITIDGDVMIIFGETERALQNELAEFIGPETIVNIDPKLKSKLD